jgi:hypothetical protein
MQNSGPVFNSPLSGDLSVHRPSCSGKVSNRISRRRVEQLVGGNQCPQHIDIDSGHRSGFREGRLRTVPFSCSFKIGIISMTVVDRPKQM